MAELDVAIQAAGAPHDADRALAELARRQHGVVARRQLLNIGLTANAIRHRLDRCRLHELHRAVYAVGHSAVTADGRWLAAVLACGEGALLSHRSAAALWGLRPASGSLVDVAVGRGRVRGGRGIRIHHSRTLEPTDAARRAGIPVTSVARTLVDLASIVNDRRLRRAMEEAERLELLDLRAIAELCERTPRRHGMPAVRAIIADRVDVPPTRLELERRFAEMVRAAGLPAPSINVWVASHEVDALWAERRLIVELDGFEFHRSREAFERDRERDAALQLAGYRVMRVTWRRLVREPFEVAAQIRALLSARPPDAVSQRPA